MRKYISLLQNFSIIALGISVGLLLRRNPQIILKKAKNVVKNKTKSAVSPTVKIACLLSTDPKIKDKFESLYQTWLNKCDKLVIISKPFNMNSEFVPYSIENETFDDLWEKMQYGYNYVHDLYINKYDWFLKADADTYIIMENLKEFLKKYNPNHAYYFGKYISIFL